MKKEIKDMYEKFADYTLRELRDVYMPVCRKLKKHDYERFRQELQKNHNEICESKGLEWVAFLKSDDYDRLEAAVCLFIAGVKI